MLVHQMYYIGMENTYALIVYGGAFNPPHQGHAEVIRQLAVDSSTVLVVPSYRHGHGEAMAPFEVRCQWLEQMLTSMSLPNVHLDTCEEALAHGHDRPIYTWDLLHYLAQRDGLEGSQIAFVIGEDNVPALPRFYRGHELQQHFGVKVIRETLSVHSTDIRHALECNQPLPGAWLAPGLQEYDFDYYR